MQKKIWFSLFYLHVLLIVLFKLFDNGTYEYLFYIQLFVIHILFIFHVIIFTAGLFLKKRTVLVIIQAIVVIFSIVYYLYIHRHDWSIM
jgi:hypothetical protein